jgi:reverse gyrase
LWFQYLLFDYVSRLTRGLDISLWLKWLIFFRVPEIRPPYRVEYKEFNHLSLGDG